MILSTCISYGRTGGMEGSITLHVKLHFKISSLIIVR
jgi:hypothetical protein